MQEIERAGERPAALREPRAFRASHVEEVGRYRREGETPVLRPAQPALPSRCSLPWTGCRIHVAT